MLRLSNVDLPTIAGDAIYTRCFQAKVILNRQKKTDDLCMQEVLKVVPKKGKNAINVRSSVDVSSI